MSEPLSIQLANGILSLGLARPNQLNALNHDLLQALDKAVTDAATNPDVRALLIYGEGKGFCAGADIKHLNALNGMTGLQFARVGQAIFRKLELLPKPSLAAIHGFALGGGLELAMAASLRIAQADSVFGQPEVKLGVIPGYGGTQRLARLIGKGRALDMCLSGKKINVTAALEWGLITEIVSGEELLVRAKALLHELIDLPALALASILTTIDYGYEIPLDAALELEAQQFALCCTTLDKEEGVSAFLEKRVPKFKGK